MFRCPVGVWVIEQRAIMLNATVRSPTVMLYFDNYVVCNINSDDVYKIVTPCCVKIENIT